MTASIESMALASRIAAPPAPWHPAAPLPNSLALRVHAQTMAGMQKVALVTNNQEDLAWQLICDEGPYLNGSDLAPPPLAFFCAGMVASYASHILSLGRQEDSVISGLQLTLDQYFSMSGSAIRGTMQAEALAPELTVQADSPNSSAIIELTEHALQYALAERFVRTPLIDQFALNLNGQTTDLSTMAPCQGPMPPDPSSAFALLQQTTAEATTGVIEKVAPTALVDEADHGVGAALKEHQKRRLHLRSTLSPQDDGLLQVQVQIIQPIGSVFRFLVDPTKPATGPSRAPQPASLLAAGLAFCFMTQIGRYSQITKKAITRYRLVQDVVNRPDQLQPVMTYSFLDGDEEPESARQILHMSEQTCFLHALCRCAQQTQVRAAS